MQFDGYLPQAEGDAPQAPHLHIMADQAAEPQRGLSLCPEECARHFSELFNRTVPGADEHAATKSFGAPCSFRVVRDSERCDGAAPGAAPEEDQVLEVAEFKAVKVKASSAAAAPAVRHAHSPH